MSSSGSRGPPPGRYGERDDRTDRNDYDYNKLRRKNFYGPSRRDFKNPNIPPTGSGPGVDTSGTSSGPPEGHYSGHPRARYGSSGGPGLSSLSRSTYGKESRGSYGTYGSSKGPYNSYNGSNSGSYYNNNNNYGSFSSFSAKNRDRDNAEYPPTSSSSYKSNTGGSRNEPWKSRPGTTGPGRPPKPLSSPTAGNRYDSYGGHIENSGSNGRWKNSFGSPSGRSGEKPLSLANRTSLSGSVGSRAYSSKDRIRGSLSNSVGGRNVPSSAASGSDSYYDSRGGSASGSLSRSTDKFPPKKRFENDVPELRGPENSKFNVSPSPTSQNNTFEELEDGKNSDDDDDSRLEADVSAKDDGFDNADSNDEEEDAEDDELAGRLKLEEYEPEYVKPPPKEPKPEAETKPIPKIDVSDEICYPEGCIHPLNKLETQFNDLKTEFESLTKKEDVYPLKFSLAKPVTDLYDYPFYGNNLKSFASHRKEELTAVLSQNRSKSQKKKLSLWNRYSTGLEEWEGTREKMDEQLKHIYLPDDETKKELESIDIRVKNSDPQSNAPETNTPTNELLLPPSGRRGRRHGDLVTTEAEFEEILKTLGKELEEDPMIRAQKVSAKIPDLILDPMKRDVVKFMDANNIVEDKKTWADRVKSDFFDDFSESEHDLFTDAFIRYPKRFGAISRYMGGLRTAEECVLHYYISKKAVNYKFLVAQYKKKTAKKGGRRAKVKKTVSLSSTPVTNSAEFDTEMANAEEKAAILPAEIVQTAPIAVAVNSLEAEIPQSSDVKEPLPAEVQPEEVYTDTGRRKRAAAPTFEGSTKTQETEQPTETKEVEAPPKKRQKKRKEEAVTESALPAKISDNEVADGEVPQANGVANGPVAEETETKDRKKTISSYWSITEANAFPALLEEFGTKWTNIADHLSSKTATMVRNYYQRNCEKNLWNEIAEAADARWAAKFAAVVGPNSGDELGPGTIPVSGSLPDVSGASGYVTAISGAPGTIPAIPTASGPVTGSSTLPGPTSAVTGVSFTAKPPILATRPPRTAYDPTKEAPTPDIYSNSYLQRSKDALFVPIGTFQHKLPANKPTTGSISSLLAEPSRPPPQEIRPKIEPVPHKSSIMSLLNSDSSPARPEKGLVDSVLEKLEVDHVPGAKSSLKSLLNSPSAVLRAQFEPPRPRGLSALLSATDAVNKETEGQR